MQHKIMDLGLVDFVEAWKLQKQALQEIKAGLYNCALILCRHYPVITLGRGSNIKNILVDSKRLKDERIQSYEIERGGDVTYHGPGQLIAYPVLNLCYFKKDIHWYLRKLEDLVIECLGDFKIRGSRREGLTGVWINKEKIASIGIAIKSWVSYHGLSINVKESDLANFSYIRPCGMDINMVSMETLLARKVNIESVMGSLTAKFNEMFKIRGG